MGEPMMSARIVLVTLIVAVNATPTEARAQATGLWVAATGSYQGALSQSRLGGVPLFGGAFGLTGGTRQGLGGYVMFGAADVRASGADTVPGRAKRLEIGAELRYRPQGNGDYRNAEYYLVLGAGVARTARDTAAGVAPHAHAGVGLALPVRGPIGIELRTVIAADRANAISQGFLPGPDAPAARLKVSLRAGLSVYFRPVARERRVPPQYVPELPSRPQPATTFEGLLRARESIQQPNPLGPVGGDPVARPGGVIGGPTYMRQVVVTDTLESVPAPVPRRTRRATATPIQTPRDMILVIADTLVPGRAFSEVLQPVPATPRAAPPVSRATVLAVPVRPVLSQTSPAPAIVYVQTDRGLVPMRMIPADDVATPLSTNAIPAPVVTPAAPPPSPFAGVAGDPGEAPVPAPAEPVRTAAEPVKWTKADELARSEDGDGSYLTVTPEQDEGFLPAASRDRVTRFTAANLSRPGFAVALIVSAVTRDPKGTQQARAAVADLRSALLAAGVPAAQLHVREWSSPGDETTVRVVYKSVAGLRW